MMSDEEQEHDDVSQEKEEKPETLCHNGILDENGGVNRSKLSQYDVAALTLKKSNPVMTPHAIGQALVRANLSKSPATIYKRLSKSQYLSAEFSQLEKSLREQLVREEYPLARKAIRKILKDKDNKVPPNAQVAAAKLIYDKVHADRMEQPGSPVNIENIERLQVLISQDVSHITADNEQ